jgi:sec-independent protein translocase protein TatC
VYPFVTAFSFLFLTGCLFAFFILLPFVVFGTLIFLGYTGAAPFVNINDFYSLIFFTIIITGISFTLPVFVVLLVKFGVIDTKILTKRRKYVWTGTYILTAIITPDGGPLADVALFIPIILLIEGSVLVARRYEKQPRRRAPFLERSILRCTFCEGPIDSGGVFCGRCGKSRI